MQGLQQYEHLWTAKLKDSREFSPAKKKNDVASLYINVNQRLRWKLDLLIDKLEAVNIPDGDRGDSPESVDFEREPEELTELNEKLKVMDL